MEGRGRKYKTHMVGEVQKSAIERSFNQNFITTFGVLSTLWESNPKSLTYDIFITIEDADVGNGQDVAASAWISLGLARDTSFLRLWTQPQKMQALCLNESQNQDPESGQKESKTSLCARFFLGSDWQLENVPGFICC